MGPPRGRWPTHSTRCCARRQMNGRRPATSRRWRLTGFRYRWRHESRLADQDRNRTRRLPRRARRNDCGRAAVFLTCPFEPASDGNPGGEFNALYLFDATGEFVSAQIESFGPRGTFNRESKEVAYRQLLEGLGAVAFQRIEGGSIQWVIAVVRDRSASGRFRTQSGHRRPAPPESGSYSYRHTRVMAKLSPRAGRAERRHGDKLSP